MAKAVKQVKYKALFTNAADQGGGWHFLVVEPDVVKKFAFDSKSRRVICTIKGGEPFPCALMPWGDIFYIMVNKLRRAELGLEVGQTVDIVLEKDESKYGMPMPEELEEVLRQDSEGNRLFHALTPGKQRSLIHGVFTIKDIDKRIHTALIIVEHLKENGGKVIGDRLYEELKRPMF
jgi:hypothetical protein